MNNRTVRRAPPMVSDDLRRALQHPQRGHPPYPLGAVPIAACAAPSGPAAVPVPPQLRYARRWLLWISVPDPDPTVKPRKMPYYASGRVRQGTLDTPDDLAQLVTYDEAMQVKVSNPGRYAGLAIALGPDGTGNCWQGIDLDGVADKQLSDLANALPGYVEYSPSMKGCHAIGYGRHFAPLASNASGIEAYANGRFFTFTEHPIRLAPLGCLANYVETVLAPRHSITRPTASTELVPVDPQTMTELRSALFSMRSDDRDLWVRMGLALKELGNAGRGLWLEWSSQSEKHRPKADAKTWDGFVPHSTGYQAVFAEAQRIGWINPRSSAAQLPAPEMVWSNGDWAPPDLPTGMHSELLTRSASSIQMESIEWLWEGFIACSFLNLVVGETSAGKSTVIADITARVTTGRPWPGEDLSTPLRFPGRVLWLGSEDPMEILTVPRLVASNADLSRVQEITGVSRLGQRNTLSMQDDLHAVRAEIKKGVQSGEPYAMLVIDPVTSYLSGSKLRKVDMNDSGQLRTILEPWVVLAKETGIAIVGVTHLAKDTTRSLLHRVLGGGAFAQLCRSLIAVVNLPEGEQFEKAMLQVKTNLPNAPRGAWRFRTDQRSVGMDKRGKSIEATFPVWDKLDSSITPESLAGGSRGPVSKYPAAFGAWLSAHFMMTPYNEGQQVANVKAAAIAAGVVTARWWDEHSGKYLDKQNVNGVWLCRPKTTH